jgi:hypothetical protein
MRRALAVKIAALSYAEVIDWKSGEKISIEERADG